MKQYKYVAMNLKKEKFNGIFIAEDEEDLAAQLQKQGLFLVSCKLYSGSVKQSFFSLSVGSGSVKKSEINSFCRQFAIMLNSGVPILRCLDVLKEQRFSKMLKSVLSIIDDDVRAGSMFSEALNKHKKVFPVFFRSMIAVGEKSGRMGAVLNSLADYYEKETVNKRKIKGALSYPIMLAFMTIGIVILMLVYIVPTFRENIAALGITPTGLTKIVYDISDFVISEWLNMLAIVMVVVFLLFIIGKTKKGRYFYDELKMKLPGFASLNRATLSSRFASSFGLLLASGMNVIDALEATTIIINNKYVEKKYLQAIEDIKIGSTIVDAFEKYNLFPAILLQMLDIGEKTNSLENVLNHSTSYFNNQVDAVLSQITTLIQPIMLCIMGLTVGVLFIAIYSPMIDIMEMI